MKRSREIRLTLLKVLAASALAAGCGSRSQQDAQGWQACVDTTGTVSDDRRCQDEQRTPHASGYVPYYHWYYYRPYGGSYLSVPPVGQRVPPGGEFSATPFSGIARSGPVGSRGAGVTSGVSRGGFGSTASGKAGA